MTTTLKDVLLRTHKNLQILKRREAGQGLTPDLKLLNEIDHHQKAVQLIRSLLSVELTPTTLERLKNELRPLLIASNVEQIDLETVRPILPLLPFEPETLEIPAGPFLMGSEDGEAIESPQHRVNLPAYRIGRYPVTNAQYAEFIRQEKEQETPKKVGWFLREPPADKLDHPVVGVSWYDAQAYCRWLSRQTNYARIYRLPTEAEWEKAASWVEEQPPLKRKYPWGDTFEAERCNSAQTALDDTTPVKRYSPAGDSFWDCADMAGNVQEWTSTLWGSDLAVNSFPYPYQAQDGREDLAADQRLHRVFRVYRGGSFRDEPARLRCTARGQSSPESKLRWRGFRVVLEI
jgi:iron(II)-dependent oxidoreductase